MAVRQTLRSLFGPRPAATPALPRDLSVEIDGRRIPIEVKTSPRARRVTLRADATRGAGDQGIAGRGEVHHRAAPRCDAVGGRRQLQSPHLRATCAGGSPAVASFTARQRERRPSAGCRIPRKIDAKPPHSLRRRAANDA